MSQASSSDPQGQAPRPLQTTSEDSRRKPPEIRKPSLRPGVGRLIIQKDPPKQQESLIAIPDAHQVKSRFATVVAVYEGSPTCVGQRIFTAQYRGTPIEDLPDWEGCDLILERDIYLFID